MTENKENFQPRPARTAIVSMISLGLTLLILAGLFGADPTAGHHRQATRMAMMEKFDMVMANAVSDALDGVLSLEKVYWLDEEDLVAPEPDPEKFGEATDPKELKPVLDAAEKLLDGQKTLFQSDTQIRKDSVITYYLDETILCITWQHTDADAVYTCSEVKIAHPSQFRRFLSDGEYGSGKLYKATEMAASVNAVTASNGDYYAYRNYGNLVYNGEVKRSDNTYLDTCYVDENGDLIMVDYYTLYKKADLEAFVEENNIRFSMAFGPILIRDGKLVVKIPYPIGEVADCYSRAALCQLGPLHYMLVTVSTQQQDLYRVSRHLLEMGVPNAYTLDGGQTATIVTNDRLMHKVDYGGQRDTSDIIYFATALPGGG